VGLIEETHFLFCVAVLQSFWGDYLVNADFRGLHADNRRLVSERICVSAESGSAFGGRFVPNEEFRR
jgi:hypothetical protein